MRHLCLLLCCGLASAAVVRIGDAGSQPDPARFDPRFPAMAEWAVAGVSGGVPEHQRVVGRVAPGEPLQAAIDAADASEQNPGVLLVAVGEHPFDGVLRLKPGLVLRGEDRARSLLVSTLNEAVATYGVDEKHAVEMASWSGLEDLTLTNGAVRAIPEQTYLGKYDNFGAPKSGLLRFGGKVRDAWVQRCDLTHAGSNPISLGASHITIRDCLIDKAHNKGGKGHGYLELGGAKHILFYNCDIRDIRHVSIMWKSRWVVIYGCRLNVDINYHDGLPLDCLVERTVIERRGGHHWSPICFGWPPWQDVGPGPGCLLWANDFDGEGGGGSQVWLIRDTSPGYANLAEKQPMLLDGGSPPAHGTLYAVTGQDIPYAELLAARSVDELDKAYRAGAWRVAVARALTVREYHPAGSAEAERAAQVLSELEERAAADFVKVGARPSAKALREFLDTWDGTRAAAEARGQAQTMAEAEYAELASGRIATAKLRRFIGDWQGLATIAAAEQAFATLADEDWAKVEKRCDRPDECRDFMADWLGTPAAGKAEERLNEVLRGALERLAPQIDRLSAKQREAAFAEFAGTAVEAEARKLLLK